MEEKCADALDNFIRYLLCDIQRYCRHGQVRYIVLKRWGMKLWRKNAAVSVRATYMAPITPRMDGYPAGAHVPVHATFHDLRQFAAWTLVRKQKATSSHGCRGTWNWYAIFIQSALQHQNMMYQSIYRRIWFYSLCFEFLTNEDVRSANKTCITIIFNKVDLSSLPAHTHQV